MKNMESTVKKLFVLVAALVLLNSTAGAQELGIRYGEVSAGKWAVDAVFSIGSLNRVHADLSFDNGMGLDGLWQFIHKRIKGESFNYYFGVGTFLYIEANDDEKKDDKVLLGALGEAGIEYKFREVPLVIGLDWRPSFQIVDKTKLRFGGFGFNARIVF